MPSNKSALAIGMLFIQLNKFLSTDGLGGMTIATGGSYLGPFFHHDMRYQGDCSISRRARVGRICKASKDGINFSDSLDSNLSNKLTSVFLFLEKEKLMHNVAYAVLLMAGLPLNAAPIPRVEAIVETTPIPAGEGDTDDPAIWVHPTLPEKSLILGTSKYGKNGQGGLAVYNLQGQELQFLAGNKLNNVDLDQDLAIATNRSLNALDFFTIEDGVVSFSGRAPLFDQQGQSFEPYGLCVSPLDESQLSIFLPTKSGIVFHFQALRQPPYSINLIESIDIGSQVSLEQDTLIRDVVTKEVLAEGDEDELEEKLQERFILEACVFDPLRKKVYIGMENLGIWSLDFSQPNPKPKLMTSIQGSWTDIGEWEKPGTSRITDDIEGMDVIQRGDQSYLLFSSQGISEFSLFDLQAERWMENFQIGLNTTDPITFTDGLAVVTQALGSQYPQGILVVHDDQNTDAQGNVQRANYKIVSLADVWQALKKD